MSYYINTLNFQSFSAVLSYHGPHLKYWHTFGRATEVVSVSGVVSQQRHAGVVSRPLRVHLPIKNLSTLYTRHMFGGALSGHLSCVIVPIIHPSCKRLHYQVI